MFLSHLCNQTPQWTSQSSPCSRKPSRSAQASPSTPVFPFLLGTSKQDAGGEGGNQRQMNSWTDPRWAPLPSYMGQQCLDTSSINHHLHRTHVPFMETQHSEFYSICTKEGETRADLVPNSTVNTRCFFPLAISDQNSIFGTHITRHSWLTYLSKYTHHDSLCSFPVFTPLCIEQNLWWDVRGQKPNPRPGIRQFNTNWSLVGDFNLAGEIGHWQTTHQK